MTTGTIAISGATGFVGRHLTSSLLARGHDVLVLVRADSDRSKIPQLPAQSSIVKAADLGAGEARSRLRRCTAWINAATAYGRGDASDAELVRTANIDYPLGILGDVIEAGCRTVVNFDSFFAKEELIHDHLPAYTAAKKEFVKKARLRIAGTDTSLLNLRLEHVYGPRDDPKKFVSWLLTQLLKNTPRIPLSEGLQERDFVFVDDVVSATQAVLDGAPRMPGAVTTIPIGSGVKTSIRGFATLAKEICASTSELDFGAVPSNGRGIESSCADTQYLEALGWRSKTSLREGIERTFVDLQARSIGDPAASTGQ